MKPTAFYVSSYFWDRATDAGIIGEKTAITWTLKPTDFSAAAGQACHSSVSGLASSFPNVRLLPEPLPKARLLPLYPWAPSPGNADATLFWLLSPLCHHLDPEAHRLRRGRRAGLPLERVRPLHPASPMRVFRPPCPRTPYPGTADAALLQLLSPSMQ